MKIKSLRNLGAGLPALAENEVADVDDETAAALIEKKLAEPADAGEIHGDEPHAKLTGKKKHESHE